MDTSTEKVSLGVIAKEWLRLGVTGFGGPPAHIALLRKLCVEKNNWIDSSEFEDSIATTNLLPGPASTQLAIFCAWKLRGVRGALLGGVCFILPGLALIIGLSVLFLAKHPMNWILGTAGGAGATLNGSGMTNIATITASDANIRLLAQYVQGLANALATQGIIKA